ncbi:hypothetical protein SCUP515_12890 [Seiridium cupressi]
MLTSPRRSCSEEEDLTREDGSILLALYIFCVVSNGRTLTSSEKVRGEKVRGEKVRGEKVRGEKVRGEKIRSEKIRLKPTSLLGQREGSPDVRKLSTVGAPTHLFEDLIIEDFYLVEYRFLWNKLVALFPL